MLIALASPRRGELEKLQWSDVDLVRGTIRVPKGKTKARTVPIHPPARDGPMVDAQHRSVRYARTVTALKAHVKNGRIVVDEPVDLPDGAEFDVYLYDAAANAMTARERAAFEQALTRSIAQADAGDLIEADDVLAEPQRP